MNDNLDFTITRLLSEHPGPVAIDAFSAVMPQGTSLRTLQRKLDEMIRRGSIEREGKARATRYKLPRPSIEYRDIVPEFDAIRLNEDTIPYETPSLGDQASVELSPESKPLRDIIRQPQGPRNFYSVKV